MFTFFNLNSLWSGLTNRGRRFTSTQMWTPRPSRRVVSSASDTLLLCLLLLAGAADAAPLLVGVFPKGELRSRAYLRTSFLDLLTESFPPDEAYFATQVIACRDGSGSFPRSRLNDGYCDCGDGTDEPGVCLHLSWICPNLTGNWELNCGISGRFHQLLRDLVPVAIN